MQFCYLCVYFNVCRYAEVLVLLSFIVLALLWFLREPRFIPGWGDIFPQTENRNRWEKIECTGKYLSEHGGTQIFAASTTLDLMFSPFLNSAVLYQMVLQPFLLSSFCSSFHRFPVFLLHQPEGDHQTVSGKGGKPLGGPLMAPLYSSVT